MILFDIVFQHFLKLIFTVKVEMSIIQVFFQGNEVVTLIGSQICLSDTYQVRQEHMS